MSAPGHCRLLVSCSRPAYKSLYIQSALSTATRASSTSSCLTNRPSTSTTSSSPLLRCQKSQHKTPLRPSISFLAIRQASTSSSAPPASSTSTQLTWNEFLQLRRTRRYINLFASVGTALGSIAVTVPIMAQYELENSIAGWTGLDPFIAIGLTMTAIGGVGWLSGPVLGNVVFGIWKSGVRGEIAKREKDFYAHIKRYRADPASSSVNNPVPDYYGEKIGSVADYRRWLKDQRAFNRKKSKNLI